LLDGGQLDGGHLRGGSAWRRNANPAPDAGGTRRARSKPEAPERCAPSPAGAATTLTTEPGRGFRDGLAVVRAIGSAATTAVETGMDVPPSTALHAGPNPARGDVRLLFSLPVASDVDARVFDVAGREVQQLHRGSLAAGQHGLRWDGRDADGRSAPAGVYFARVETGGTTRVARIVRTR
jgi:hypothetical protein